MIRTKQHFILHLVRHAEAYKNLAKRHGGGDQRLTPKGEQQAKRLGRYLLDAARVQIGRCNIIYQPEGRSEATAKHIGQVVTGHAELYEELIGIDLGERAGLSESQLAERYPEVSAALAEWRSNKGFRVPDVPGGERLEAFAERINRGLVRSIERCGDGESLVIVGTTSSLVMVHHLLSRDGQLSAPDYEFIDAPLGSVSTWRISEEPPVQLTNLIVPGEN